MAPIDWVMLVFLCISVVGATTSYLRAYHLRRGKKDTQHLPITLPTLPAGPELDRRIAEELMRLIPCDQWDGPYPQEGGLMWNHTGPTDHQCYRQGHPPPYSQTWAQAWDILEELRRRKRVVVLKLDGRRSDSKGTVIIDQFPAVEAGTLVHALALAALNSVKPERPPISASISQPTSRPLLNQVIQVSVNEAVRGHVQALTAQAMTSVLRDHSDIPRGLERHIAAALQEALSELERADQAEPH